MSTRSHESEAPSGVETRFRRLLGNAGFWADWTAPIALIVLSVIFTLRSPVFLSEQNIRGMLADSSLIIVLALGLTFVIAIGGIDLSIATTVTLASVMMGVAYTAGWPLLLVVLVGLATGALVGSFNGVLVGRVKIPDFIVTLGSFSLTSGIALVVSQGIPVQISDQALRTLSTGSFWLFRFNFLLAVALSIALHVLLFHMRFGTYVLATGGNLDAACAVFGAATIAKASAVPTSNAPVRRLREARVALIIISVPPATDLGRWLSVRLDRWQCEHNRLGEVPKTGPRPCPLKVEGYSQICIDVNPRLLLVDARFA